MPTTSAANTKTGSLGGILLNAFKFPSINTLLHVWVRLCCHCTTLMIITTDLVLQPQSLLIYISRGLSLIAFKLRYHLLRFFFALVSMLL